MRNYKSTVSKLLLVLFSLACMAFFAMPLLWLLTAPFTPMTTLSVESRKTPPWTTSGPCLRMNSRSARCSRTT